MDSDGFRCDEVESAGEENVEESDKAFVFGLAAAPLFLFTNYATTHHLSPTTLSLPTHPLHTVGVPAGDNLLGRKTFEGKDVII